MTDDQFLLANAFLDGELTAEERARAEADPVVMAEVAELRALQALVGDVDPPSDAACDGAIAAAMAVFTAESSHATAAASAAAPIPFRPRPAYAKYLAVAAGVLGIGLLGVVVAKYAADRDGDDSANEAAVLTAEPAADEPAAEDRLVENATEADAAGDDQFAEAEISAADAASEPADAPAAAAEEPAAEEPAADLADDAVIANTSPAVELGQMITSTAQLGAYGELLLDLVDAGKLGPTPNHSCPFRNVLATAEFFDESLTDVSIDVYIDVDQDLGVVTAIDADTCHPIAEAPLPGR